VSDGATTWTVIDVAVLSSSFPPETLGSVVTVVLAASLRLMVYVPTGVAELAEIDAAAVYLVGAPVHVTSQFCPLQPVLAAKKLKGALGVLLDRVPVELSA
jgi:hypothetical protein